MELDVDTLIKLVQGLGFPVFVAAYLLIVMSKNLRENTQALHDLKVFLEATHSPKP